MESQALLVDSANAGAGMVVAKRLHLITAVLCALFYPLFMFMPDYVHTSYWPGIEQTSDAVKSMKYLFMVYADFLLAAISVMYAVSRTKDPVLLKRSCLLCALICISACLFAFYALASGFGGPGNYSTLAVDGLLCAVFVYGYMKLGNVHAPQDDQATEGAVLAKRMLFWVGALCCCVGLELLLAPEGFLTTNYYPGLSSETAAGTLTNTLCYKWCGLFSLWWGPELILVSYSSDVSTMKDASGLTALLWAYGTLFYGWLCYIEVAGNLMRSMVVMDVILTSLWCYTFFTTKGAVASASGSLFSKAGEAAQRVIPTGV